MNKIRRMLLGMLIVLSINTFFSFPPGIHLELCFGYDGHVDVTPDACIADFKEQSRQQVENVNEHHRHENCLDVVIGCTSLDILLRTSGRGDLFETNIVRNDLFTMATCAVNEAQPGQSQNRCAYPYQGDMPSSSVLSHQTVVLLI